MSRRPLLILAAVVFVLHALVTSGRLTSPDEELLFRMAESIALRGTTQILPLEADIATGALPEGITAANTFATRPGKDPGSFYAQYLPFQPLMAAPLVWLGAATESLAGPAYGRLMWPGMPMSYLEPLDPDALGRAAWRRAVVVILFNPLVAALSAVLLARLGTYLTGNRRAGIAAGACWAFGTIGWAHSKTFFTEPLAALLVLAAIDQLIRWNRAAMGTATWRAALIGIFLGLANLTRVDSPFFTLGVGVSMLVLAVWKLLQDDGWAREHRRGPVVDLAIAGAIAVGCWIGLQSFNSLRFGPDLTSGYGHQSEGVKFSTPLIVGLHGLFFSPGKGLFFFSPAIILGLWGWMRIAQGTRWIRTVMAISLIPFLLAMAKWQNWDGGWCWGPRHIVQLHLPIMLGVAFLWPTIDGFLRKLVVQAVIILGVGVQLFGTSQSSTDYYREFFLTYDDLVYHQVNLRGMQEQAMRRYFALHYREADGRLGGEISPAFTPAPFIDSLYLPQHTQWWSYRTMWQLGYRDWLVVNALRSGRNPDRWSRSE